MIDLFLLKASFGHFDLIALKGNFGLSCVPSPSQSLLQSLALIEVRIFVDQSFVFEVHALGETEVSANQSKVVKQEVDNELMHMFL